MTASTATLPPPSVDVSTAPPQPPSSRRLTASKPSPFLRPSIYPISPPKFGNTGSHQSLLTSGAALQGNASGAGGDPSSSALDIHQGGPNGTGWSPSLGASAQLYGASPMSFGMAGLSFSRPSPLAGGGAGGQSMMMLDPTTGSWRGAGAGGPGSFRFDGMGSAGGSGAGGFASFANGREGILMGTSVRDE